MSAPVNIPDTTRARVLVVGDVMLDRYWFGEVNRISPEAPVPVVHVQRTEERPGGAANVARNAVALGAQSTLLSVVGDDEPAAALQRLLLAEGVDARLRRDAGLSTTIKLRVIGRQQQLLRIDFENLPAHEVLRDKLAEFKALLPDYDVVVLSDYGKGGLAHVAEMIQAARPASRCWSTPKGKTMASTGAPVC
jgi:rfaE bifunctional protein kinase chain/domain